MEKLSTKEQKEILERGRYTCTKCGKEIIPVITKIDEDNYESNIMVVNIRGGIGNEVRGKLCEKCYESAKLMLEGILKRI